MTAVRSRPLTVSAMADHGVRNAMLAARPAQSAATRSKILELGGSHSPVVAVRSLERRWLHSFGPRFASASSGDGEEGSAAGAGEGGNDDDATSESRCVDLLISHRHVF